jgi:hypothetical protein
MSSTVIFLGALDLMARRPGCWREIKSNSVLLSVSVTATTLISTEQAAAQVYAILLGGREVEDHLKKSQTWLVLRYLTQTGSTWPGQS